MSAFLKNNVDFKDFSKYVSLNVLGMLAFNCYILADTYFVSNGVGLDALAALNLALPLFGLISGFGMMLGMGGATGYAILRAEGKNGAPAFMHSLLLALLLSVVFELTAVFAADKLSVFLGADGDTFAYTTEYVSVLMYFAPAFFFNQVFICFVRNDSNPVLAMFAVAAGSIVNVILDYVFIYPLQMGMLGAVLATGLAPVISLVILSSHWLVKRRTLRLKLSRFSFRTCGRICSLGIFSFVSEISNGIVILVFNMIIINLTGNTGVAAYGVIVNVFYVALGFFNGVSQGIQPLVSRRYGQNRPRNAKRVFKYGLITAFVMGAALYIISAVFSEGIVGLFNSENSQQLEELAVPGMRIFFTALFFSGFNIVTAGFFSATGRGGKAFAVSFARGLLVIIPLAYLFAGLLGMTGVWLSFPITEIAVAVFAGMLLLNFFKTYRHRNSYLYCRETRDERRFI